MPDQFMESLERRRLLSVSANGTNVYVRGTEAADNIVLSLSTDRTTFDVYDNGLKTSYTGTIRRVYVLGLGGDDVIGVSQTNGPITTSLLVWGGTGNDTLVGGSALDVLFGGQGDDVIYGQGGNDWIWGGVGRDQIFGGDGNDRLWGNEEQDILYGQAGQDRFDARDATSGTSAEVLDLEVGDFVGANIVTPPDPGEPPPPPAPPPPPPPVPQPDDQDADDDDRKDDKKNKPGQSGRHDSDDDDDKDDDDDD